MILQIGNAVRDLDPGTLKLVIGICTLLIAALISVVAFFIKREFKITDERFKDQEKKNNEQHELQKDLNKSLQDLNVNLTALSGTVRSINDFGKINSKAIEKIDNKLDTHILDKNIHVKYG